MEWKRSRQAVPRFEFLTQAGSTNDELRDAATGAHAADWPHGSVIVTDDQTRGRGRLGRVWLAPAGKTLAISVLLRPVALGLPIESFGWIPLIAGAAMSEAVRRAVGRAASASRDIEGEADDSGGVIVELKWPNDVLISGFKVCGILSELTPDHAAVVVGAGLNLTLDEHDLPTLTSTSIQLVTGREPDADAVLADYLGGFLAAVATFAAGGGDAGTSGIAAWVAGECGTLGSEVRVELPGGNEVIGVAERIDSDGRLVVRSHEHGLEQEQSVAAGDVTHLRY